VKLIDGDGLFEPVLNATSGNSLSRSHKSQWWFYFFSFGYRYCIRFL